MKRVNLTIISVSCIFCLSEMATALSNQQTQEPSFSMFHEIPACRQLTEFYIENGQRKPIAQLSLPLEYHIHESIPSEYRPRIHDQAEDWNNTLGNEMVRINSKIDRGDPTATNSDQKNVIYLVDSEDYTAHILNSPNHDITKDPSALISSANSESIISPELAQNFLPITNADIFIREETLTNIGFYRHLLFATMRDLGIEGDFSNEHIEVIRSAIVEHIINMSSQDVKTFLIEDIEAGREELETFRETRSNQNLTSDVSDTIDRRLDEIDQRLEEIHNMTDEQIRTFKINLTYNRLSVDMDTMESESQSSITFENVIRHEMGHGLGLRDYVLFNNHPMRNLNIMGPYLVQAYGQITIRKEIGTFAIYGLYCLYSGYPDFIQHY